MYTRSIILLCHKKAGPKTCAWSIVGCAAVCLGVADTIHNTAFRVGYHSS